MEWKCKSCFPTDSARQRFNWRFDGGGWGEGGEESDNFMWFPTNTRQSTPGPGKLSETRGRFKHLNYSTLLSSLHKHISNNVSNSVWVIDNRLHMWGGGEGRGGNLYLSSQPCYVLTGGPVLICYQGVSSPVTSIILNYFRSSPWYRLPACYTVELLF